MVTVISNPGNHATSSGAAISQETSIAFELT